MKILNDIVTDVVRSAVTDNDRFTTFFNECRKRITMPADAYIAGLPVVFIGIKYSGNVLVGLIAIVSDTNGSEYETALWSVRICGSQQEKDIVDAYRVWLGLSPHNDTLSATVTRRHKVSKNEISTATSVELIILSCDTSSAYCRLRGTDRVITFRSRDIWNTAPGEIITVTSKRQWSYAGHPYLSGTVESVRLDAKALELTALGITKQSEWNPKEYFADDTVGSESWEQNVVTRGTVYEYEMEQVIPGEDPDDPDSDPIILSNELKNSGDYKGACKMLMALCKKDLRCLDAHAHLGHIYFDTRPEIAIRHYAAGIAIGNLTIGDAFDGILPWYCLDNRPYLRCMHGYALCLWRLKRFDDCHQQLMKLLYLNPIDNQGARSLINDVSTHKMWEECEEK